MEQCLEEMKDASVGYEKAREFLEDAAHEQLLEVVSSRYFPHSHIGEV
jgi:hypothetical protein